MTEKRIRALFDLWIKRLGLTEWEINVRFVEFEDGKNIARCHKSPKYDRAFIDVQPWALTGDTPDGWECGEELTPKRLEEAIVHELLHCVTARYWQFPHLLKEETHVDAYDTACRAMDDVDENIVEGLTMALVRAFGQHTLTPKRKAARGKAKKGKTAVRR